MAALGFSRGGRYLAFAVGHDVYASELFRTSRRVRAELAPKDTVKRAPSLHCQSKAFGVGRCSEQFQLWNLSGEGPASPEGHAARRVRSGAVLGRPTPDHRISRQDGKKSEFEPEFAALSESRDGGVQRGVPRNGELIVTARRWFDLARNSVQGHDARAGLPGAACDQSSASCRARTRSPRRREVLSALWSLQAKALKRLCTIGFLTLVRRLCLEHRIGKYLWSRSWRPGRSIEWT